MCFSLFLMQQNWCRAQQSQDQAKYHGELGSASTLSRIPQNHKSKLQRNITLNFSNYSKLCASDDDSMCVYALQDLFCVILPCTCPSFWKSWRIHPGASGSRSSHLGRASGRTTPAWGGWRSPASPGTFHWWRGRPPARADSPWRALRSQNRCATEFRNTVRPQWNTFLSLWKCNQCKVGRSA